MAGSVSGADDDAERRDVGSAVVADHEPAGVEHCA
jgi:hypothetical protein